MASFDFWISTNEFSHKMARTISNFPASDTPIEYSFWFYFIYISGFQLKVKKERYSIDLSNHNSKALNLEQIHVFQRQNQ